MPITSFSKPTANKKTSGKTAQKTSTSCFIAIGTLKPKEKMGNIDRNPLIIDLVHSKKLKCLLYLSNQVTFKRLKKEFKLHNLLVPGNIAYPPRRTLKESKHLTLNVILFLYS